ncbi:probable DNA-directed RNA polymerases I and III subunit RPAC2 [Leptidea sinapis]|uniref:probable DNA-directed RNA polymerases I and III subunit RPAC2 n=1 Tax=Leptidea sinapis TaxID=189913 RepID=UPI00212CA8D1|nr:probable DNA-directed RNA polymerases I and III subunit RPAC2 [Leptidea sinapis]
MLINEMKLFELPGLNRDPKCKTFVIKDEGHLGDALKCIISGYEDVQFCGYTVPCPVESKIHFKIQSAETPALDILYRGLCDLKRASEQDLDQIETKLKEYNNHSCFCKMRTKQAM